MISNDEFEEKIERITESGCWICINKPDKDGYCRIGFDHISERAHRLSWRLYRGEIPEGLFVLHHCDNPSCCNPHHLFLGTNQDNMADMHRKGRGVDNRGSRHGNAKLTEEKVRAIRSDHREQKEIAKDYGMSKSVISNVINRLCWKHV